MDHPVLAWLSANGLTQAWLALQIRKSKQLVSAILLGTTTCGGQTAVKISRATRGEVSVEAVILWRPKSVRRRTRRAA